MITSRAKTLLLLSLFAVISDTALAQDRDASFLPPGAAVTSASPNPAPVVAAPVSAPAITLPQLAPIATAAPAPIVAAPVITVPAATSAPTVITPPPAVTPITSTVPVPATVAAPIIIPAQPVTPAKPIDLGKPVETGTLGAIDAESTGLFSPAEGGLGATMWKGTSRALVEKVLPDVMLPTQSATLNNLAQRFLLTVASVPEGTSTTKPNLTSMRLERLLALGDTGNAWTYANSIKSDQIDETTQRMIAEDALLSPDAEAVCTKLPEIIRTHTSSDWQKLLLICQLRAKDTKASQLTLDLLHTQNVKDESFFYIAEKNINGTSKQLPRQLTPLKPLTLALLRMTDFALPGEIYVRPDAALVPELLKAKARDEATRLALAERMAERGLMKAADLSALYKSVSFTPEAVASVAGTAERGPRLHALLYQSALQEKSAQGRINDVLQFLSNSSAALASNAGATLMLEMLGDIKAANDYNASSGGIAHVYTLAGKADAAMEWIKQAKHASIGMPPVTLELQNFWPLVVLAGIEPDSDFNNDLNKWLDNALAPITGKDDHVAHDQAASILMLFDAAGFAVPDSAWAKVIDAPSFEKKAVPSALFFERLHAASTANRRGETVLLGLALNGGGDAPFLTSVETVRSLRAVGLTADAASLAREVANVIITPPVKP